MHFTKSETTSFCFVSFRDVSVFEVHVQVELSPLRPGCLASCLLFHSDWSVWLLLVFVVIDFIQDDVDNFNDNMFNS